MTCTHTWLAGGESLGILGNVVTIAGSADLLLLQLACVGCARTGDTSMQRDDDEKGHEQGERTQRKWSRKIFIGADLNEKISDRHLLI